MRYPEVSIGAGPINTIIIHGEAGLTTLLAIVRGSWKDGIPVIMTLDEKGGRVIFQPDEFSQVSV